MPQITLRSDQHQENGADEFDAIVRDLQDYVDAKDREDFSAYALQLSAVPYKNRPLPEKPGIIAYAGVSSCGDQLTLFFNIEGGKIVDVGMHLRGCTVILMASAQLLKMVDGSTLKKAKGLTTRDVLTALGKFPAQSVHSIAFVVDLLHQALDKVNIQ